MGQAKKPKRPTPKKITKFNGETKMSKENEKALKVVRAIKGMFG